MEQQLAEWILAAQWVPLSAFVVGFLVRLLKDDTKLPTVPREARPWLALGFGQLEGVLLMVIAGSAWKPAAVHGLVSSLTAIAGHFGVIEVLRGGKEITLPLVTKPTEKAERPSMRIIGGLLVLLALTGCAGNQVHPLVAGAVDPLLKVVGFCQEHGAKADDVAAIVRDYNEDRKLDAAVKTALLLHQIARDEGVQIPAEIDAAYRLAMGQIIDGMVDGLRALDCRDADGKPIEGCA